MPYLNELADILRKAGCKVVEVDGWKSRNHGPMRAVKGILCHHTAGPTAQRNPADYPSMHTVKVGRSDGLKGPLSQLGLGRSGTWYIIANGISWHSGKVDNPDFSNPYCIGIEAENSGTEPWPKAQYDAYVKGVAALSRYYSVPVRGHKEAAVPYGRKPDPSFDMNKFRADIAKAGANPTNNQGVFTMDATQKVIDYIRAMTVGGFTWQGKKHYGGFLVAEHTQELVARLIRENAEIKTQLAAIDAKLDNLTGEVAR